MPNPTYKPGARRVVPRARERVRGERAQPTRKPGRRRRARAVRDLDRGRAAHVHALAALPLAGLHPQPTCSARVHFDVWSTDPYTAGGPTHQAHRPNDVSLGDLPEMKAVLDAGVAAGHIVSPQPVQFWVTEFSWDSNPPDPAGVPAALEGRWVAEALYRMWSAGVSLVVWFTLRDQPVHTEPVPVGSLFFRRGDHGATGRSRR